MSSMPEEKKTEEKKIIVDEDWKSRVETERQAARQAPDAQAPGAEPAPEKVSDEAEADQPLPPPDLMFLATTFYMQALVALGAVPDPATRKARLRPHQARHAIDALQVLQEKTEGNRTRQESEALDAMLHQLRMAYVGALEASAGAKKK